MTELKIIDNFFSENIRKEIYDLLRYGSNWSFTGGREDRRLWHVDRLEEDIFFNTYLFNIICDELNKDFSIKRIYANGQTANQCGNPHYDDGDMTFIYYPNPVWKLEDQGHLIFLKSDDEVSNVVTYKSNRAILFPSSIKHYSDAPHRLFSGLRISLAYKLSWN